MSADSIQRFSCFPCRDKKQRCDRTFPKCSRCARQGLDCAYPDKRKSATGKRKQVRDLEAQLARLEARVNGSHPPRYDASPREESPNIGNDALLPLPETEWATESQSSLPAASLQGDSIREDTQLSDQMAAHDNMIDDSLMTSEMVNLYFEKMHHATPMIHRLRYEECLHSPETKQPPMCLQYIICATGAEYGSTCQSAAMTLYRKGREAAEADEMDDEGKYAFDVAHVQTWLLMANFEARKGIFSRAAVSLARSTRVSQMLNLYREHKIDDMDSLPPRGYGPYQDWITLEECRRTWWCIYISDRLISATSGLPSVLDATPVLVSLPASDKAFESGHAEETTTLRRALRVQAQTSSPLALRVLAASLFDRATQLAMPKDINEDEDDIVDDRNYWDRHEAIENDLNSLHLMIPENLQLPRSIECQQCVFVHVLMQTTLLSLYKSAVQRVQGSNGSDTPYTTSQCCSRMLAAASNIVKILKSMKNVFMALQNPIQDHAAYMAGLVLLSDLESGGDEASKIIDIEFLQISLQHAGETQPVALSLGKQLQEKLASTNRQG